MILQFGKHRGKSVERVVLYEPDYALWALGQEATSVGFDELQDEIRRLIRDFDNKPFTQVCMGDDCENTATRGTTYDGSNSLFWWCDECSPTQLGASPDKLRVVRTYFDVATYRSSRRNTIPAYWSRRVLAMARAKGLPEGPSSPFERTRSRPDGKPLPNFRLNVTAE